MTINRRRREQRILVVILAGLSTCCGHVYYKNADVAARYVRPWKSGVARISRPCTIRVRRLRRWRPDSPHHTLINFCSFCFFCIIFPLKIIETVCILRFFRKKSLTSVSVGTKCNVRIYCLNNYYYLRV